MEGASRAHRVQPPCQSRFPTAGCPGRCPDGPSPSREGDPTASLGSLSQHSGTLSVKNFFCLLVWSCLGSILWPLPLVLSPQTSEKRLAKSLSPTLHIFKHIDEIPPQSSLPKAEQPQVSQPLLLGKMLEAPYHLCGLRRTLSRRSRSVLYWGAQSWTQNSRTGFSPQHWIQYSSP